jgi:hypothetical protein
MKAPPPPPGAGHWTLLQERVDRALWQQDEPDGEGRIFTRFVILNPPETLTYDDFDEAEAMFLALEQD